MDGIYGVLKRRLVVFVYGATGVGKTDVAIEVAVALRDSGVTLPDGTVQHYDPHILNCDVMQMYKGLPIATNKATREETRGVPHHFLSFLDAGESVSMPEFQSMALAKIESILIAGEEEGESCSGAASACGQRHRLPIVIVCGGTAYYMQSLMFRGTDTAGDAGDLSPLRVAGEGSSSAVIRVEEQLRAVGDGDLRRRLRELNPAAADRWHPNDVRRLRNALRRELFRVETPVSVDTASPSTTAAKRHREESESECKRHGTSALGPRYPSPFLAALSDTCTSTECGGGTRTEAVALWVDGPRDELYDRINRRVDVFFDRGLKRELVEYYVAERRGGGQQPAWDVDVLRGICSSIGLKEFVPFFKSLDAALGERVAAAGGNEAGTAPQQVDVPTVLQAAETPAVVEVLNQCRTVLKDHTRRYCRQQQQWIRRRVVGPLLDALVGTTVNSPSCLPVVLLNYKTAKTEAVEFISRLLTGDGAYMAQRRGSDLETLRRRFGDELTGGEGHSTAANEQSGALQTRYCEVCDMTLSGSTQWTAHEQGKRHVNTLRRLRRHEELKKRGIDVNATKRITTNEGRMT